jgi:hypothetical protein
MPWFVPFFQCLSFPLASSKELFLLGVCCNDVFNKMNAAFRRVRRRTIFQLNLKSATLLQIEFRNFWSNQEYRTYGKLNALAVHEKRNFNPDGCGQLDNGRARFGAKRCANQIGTYWLLDESSPRYLIQDNGLMRMCPTVGPNRAMTTNRWDVRNGMFYQDGEPYKIVKLSKSEFDYEAVRGSGVEVDGKFILTCPIGTVFPLYRTTRSRAEE